MSKIKIKCPTRPLRKVSNTETLAMERLLLEKKRIATLDV